MLTPSNLNVRQRLPVILEINPSACVSSACLPMGVSSNGHKPSETGKLLGEQGRIYFSKRSS